MSRPAERPATPAVPSTPLQESHPSILSESSGSESDPISSTSECPCCRLPPVPEPSTLTEAIPQLDLNNSATLEERFLKSLAIQPAVGSTVRSAAVVPQDRRAGGRRRRGRIPVGSEGNDLRHQEQAQDHVHCICRRCSCAGLQGLQQMLRGRGQCSLGLSSRELSDK